MPRIAMLPAGPSLTADMCPQRDGDGDASRPDRQRQSKRVEGVLQRVLHRRRIGFVARRVVSLVQEVPARRSQYQSAGNLNDLDADAEKVENHAAKQKGN